MTAIATAPLPSSREMVALVDGWAGYVRSRVAACDVDDVLQNARETVLSRVDTYDPALGEPGAWVFGIVRVTVQAALRVHATVASRDAGVEVDQSLPDGRVGGGDPLAALIEHRVDLEWVRVVAELATPFEWRVVVAFAQTEGISADVAVLLGVRASTVRSARARVATLVRTARAAIRERDEGFRVALEHCIPHDGGYADILPFRSADEESSAAALGIARGTFRTRRAMLRRLERIIQTISSASAS